MPEWLNKISRFETVSHLFDLGAMEVLYSIKIETGYHPTRYLCAMELLYSIKIETGCHPNRYLCAMVV